MDSPPADSSIGSQVELRAITATTEVYSPRGVEALEALALNDAPSSADLTSLPRSDATPAQPEAKPEREKWSRKIEFLLACVGFSVGLGNVWRFPYLCYKNGGGAFLVPYIISCIICGIPVFYLEVSIGQFMNVAGVKAFNFMPLLKGIGIATTIIVFYLNCYYNVIMAWAFHYFFHSFTSKLPWSTCDNSWNTPHCVTNTSQVTSLSTDPTIEYWEIYVLDISDGISSPGAVKWDLALCLLLAWVLVFLCICKGIKSSGKVMYVTATSPYLILTALLIRGVTLPGAADGIYFYLYPDFSKLGNLQVWVDAGTQVFFSYSLCIGALTALGSFNKFRHDSFKDSVIFAAVNSGTSLFAGVAVFSTVGFMSYTLGRPVDEVAASGPGLAFIAYPTALAQMPGAPFWSVLFFLMLLLLGIDSQMVGVEGLVTALCDQFTGLRKNEGRRMLFVLGMCLVQFVIGLSMVTNGGMYVFQLFDYYSSSRIVTLVAMSQVAAVAVYGFQRWYNGLALMLGYLPGPYLKINWMVVTPAWCLALFVLGLISGQTLEFSTTRHGAYSFPAYSVGVGWAMAFSSFVFIPGVAVWQLLRHTRADQSSSLRLTTKLKGSAVALMQPHGLEPHQVRVFDQKEWLMEETREHVDNKA